MFSDWQIERMRTRLNDYRDAQRTGKQRLPISRVLDKMVERLCVDEGLYSETSIRSIDNDTLRRFSAGSQTPRGDSKLLVMLKQFLILEGVMSEAEFREDEGDQGEMLAVHSYLADVSFMAKEFALSMEQTYVATIAQRGSDLPHTKIELHFRPVIPQTCLRVTEIETRYWSDSPTAAPPQVVKDDMVVHRHKRLGFAFFSTGAYLLHVFLRGSSHSDRVTCIEVRDTGGRPGGVFSLYRGGKLPYAPTPPRTEDADPADVFGIRRFAPASSLHSAGVDADQPAKQVERKAAIHNLRGDQ